MLFKSLKFVSHYVRHFLSIQTAIADDRYTSEICKPLSELIFVHLSYCNTV